jgi:hypothetical protein
MPGQAQDHPRYLDGALDLETVYRMLLEVASELSVTRDRLVLVETLLARRDLLDEATLERTAFEPEVAERLEQDRKLLVQRLAACVPDGA